MFQKAILSTASILLVTILLGARATEFSYQGSLNLAGTSASGNFDFEFGLFREVTGDAQVAATLTRTNIVFMNGTFSSLSLVL